jgi:transcriptional regulator with XRE-family HTH domain
MNRLKSERLARSWSMKTLGGLVGVSHPCVFSWEHGQRRPYPANARKLETLFGLPIDKLLGPDDR